MANEQDGRNFIALEADFFGDGQTNETTQAVSVYKENAINNNTKWLVKNTVRICECMNTERDPDGEIRPQGSLREATRFLIRTKLYPHDESIRLTMRGGVFNNDPSVDGEVLARLELFYGDNSITRFVTWKESDDEYDITMDIPEDFIDNPRTVNIALWTSSIAGGDFVRVKTVDSFSDDNGYNTFIIVKEDDFPLAQEGSPYDGQNLVSGTTALRVDADPILRADWMGFFPYNAFGTVGHCPTLITNFNRPATPQMDEEGTQYQNYWISYIRPKSWNVEIDSNPDKSWEDSALDAGTIAYSDKNPQSMRPRTTVLGPDISEHGSLLNAAFAREKVVAVGPSRPKTLQTRDPSNGDLVSGVAEKWSLKAGSGAAVRDQVGFHLDHPKCQISIRGFMAGVSFNGAYVNGEGSDVGYTSWGSRSDLTHIVTHTADVFTFAKLAQLEDGDADWVNATVIDERTFTEPDLNFYLATHNHRVAFLRQMFFAFYKGLPLDSDFEESFGTYWPSILEGSFFNNKPGEAQFEGPIRTPSGPFSILRPFEWTFEVEDVDISKPVQLVLQQNSGGGGAINITGSDSPSDNRDKMFSLIPSYTVSVRRMI